MIPIILISQNKKTVNDFIKNLIKSQKIDKNYIFEISPLKKEILITQIRSVNQQLKISAPTTRLFIFTEFDKATVEAQNSFLKALEEQSLKNQFILVAENEQIILPTIRSRSKIIRLADKNIHEKLENEWPSELLNLVEKSADYAFLGDKRIINISREEALTFFDKAIFYYRLKLLTYPHSAAIIKKTMLLKNRLINNNVNSQIALDNLLIFIFKTIRMNL